MIKKQDRQGVRRPADIERKYNLKKMRDDTEKAKKIASEILQTDEGLSLKVEALGEDVKDVKAQLDLKVETDTEGNLKSRVHVSGNEFTVDTDNFKLDEDGNVAISGSFSTESEKEGFSSTRIEGGEILITSAEFKFVENGEPKYAHQLICFTGKNGSKYGVIAVGTYQTDSFVFEGIRIMRYLSPEEFSDSENAEPISI